MFNNEISFLKAKRKGKQGETAVKDYYLNNGSSVIDVSEDREYQVPMINKILLHHLL